jgi:dihydroorotate dehydrogenase electron transfer subunit
MRDKIDVSMAKVIKNAPITKDIWSLTLNPGPDFDVTEMSPGQFVCLSLETDSVMARPFSIAGVSVEHNSFSLLYKVVGENTRLMSQLKSGQQVQFWGPLGAGLECNIDEVWLVGGGIGIAPLLFLERALSQKGIIRRVFYGGKTVDDLVPIKNLRSKDDWFYLHQATEDGKEEYHGPVTDYFKETLWEEQPYKMVVITCGPNAMMKKVFEIYSKYVEEKGDFLVDHEFLGCYVILEKVMACGIGVCLGCSIKTTKGIKRICHDGPIFKAEEVIWDELG